MRPLPGGRWGRVVSVLLGRSYAVAWHETDGPTATGKLQLGSTRLLLEGRVCHGEPSRLELPFAELAGVHIDRSGEGRAHSWPALVLERHAGFPVHVTSLAGFGVLHELAGLVADAVGRGERADRTLSVLIAGGGVAGVETMLALRALAEDRVDVELIAPEPHFGYRPLAVAEPFDLGRAHRFELAAIASSCGARFTLGAVASVDPERQVVRTGAGAELGYDVLVLACGTQTEEAIEGALTFRGQADSEAFRRLLAEIEAGRVRRVVFAVPSGASWPLPLYELALLTAAYVGDRHLDQVELVLVTPESSPLAIFGSAAADAVGRLLAERGISVHAGRHVISAEDGRLWLVPPEGEVPFDRLVSLPRLRGTAIAGIPQDQQGFVATDESGRVRGLENVYAVGDLCAFPVKQGGIASQQADAAAEAIAARAGAPVTPRPFRPVLRGLLLTGAIPAFLRAEIAGGHGAASTVDVEPLWWPPGKIAGRYLAPFLAAHTGLTAAAVPAGPGVIPVEVDLPPAASAAWP